MLAGSSPTSSGDIACSTIACVTLTFTFIVDTSPIPVTPSSVSTRTSWNLSSRTMDSTRVIFIRALPPCLRADVYSACCIDVMGSLAPGGAPKCAEQLGAQLGERGQVPIARGGQVDGPVERDPP